MINDLACEISYSCREGMRKRGEGSSNLGRVEDRFADPEAGFFEEGRRSILARGPQGVAVISQDRHVPVVGNRHYLK
jgi:hypothetical protein